MYQVAQQFESLSNQDCAPHLREAELHIVWRRAGTSLAHVRNRDPTSRVVAGGFLQFPHRDCYDIVVEEEVPYGVTRESSLQVWRPHGPESVPRSAPYRLPPCPRSYAPCASR